MKRTPGFVAALADTWRRWWWLWLAFAAVLAGAVLFGVYLRDRQQLADHRQQIANSRAEMQRQAICAILANIPGQVAPEIVHARRVFARPGHPGDCRPLPGATPKPTPVRVYINGKPATIIVNPPAPSPSRPGPAPSRTASPRPTRTPRPSPKPSPSPSPSPSPACVHVNPIHRAICIQEAPNEVQARHLETRPVHRPA